MDEMNIIRVPRALDGLAPLLLDMTEIKRAEARHGEVAMANQLRAPELLSIFNMAWLNTSRYLSLLEYEYDVAERKLNEVKAIFLIDKLPGLLAERGMASSRSPLGSEDVREAFLAREPEVQRYVELLGNIRCYISLIEGMQKAFENSYNSVKKILGTDGNASSYRPNPNLTTSYNPTDNQTPKAVNDDFFGTPR